MTFLTGYMEAMLAGATDPLEIELRRKALEDHLSTFQPRRTDMYDDSQNAPPPPAPSPTPTPTPTPKLPREPNG